MEKKLYCVILENDTCTFYDSSIHHKDIIPEGAIEIDKEMHQNLLRAINVEGKQIILTKNKILKIVDKPFKGILNAE